MPRYYRTYDKNLILVYESKETFLFYVPTDNWYPISSSKHAEMELTWEDLTPQEQTRIIEGSLTGLFSTGWI